MRRHNSAEVRDARRLPQPLRALQGRPGAAGAHAACPWIVTWDDHEVENNYAGLVAQDPAEVPDFAARRAAAYQAWWEHQPVRLAPPTGPDLRIYRSFDWGRLARFYVLDTRQYRTARRAARQPRPHLRRAHRTRAHDARRRAGGVARRGASPSPQATWNVLANQTVMTSMPLAGALYNLDQWDGYPAARARLLDQLAAGGVENPVVLTGDIHAAGVADLVGENPDGTPVDRGRGTELVGGSISSTFDPATGRHRRAADPAAAPRALRRHATSGATWSATSRPTRWSPATRWSSRCSARLASDHRRHLGRRGGRPRPPGGLTRTHRRFSPARAE